MFGLAPAMAQAGPVSPTPATGTPELASTGTTEQVRQLVQCGSTMYAVGSFTKISWGGTTYPRNNIFSFSATSPFKINDWNPDVNGAVNSIAFNGGNCSDAYIGGQFTSVDGTAVKNIAEIDTTTGAVAPAFGHNASGQVETLLAVNGHLLTGGAFTSINGSGANPYYASLNPTSGKDDGYLHLSISGHYVYPGVGNNTTKVANQQLSPDGSRVLVEGVFTEVGGQARQQIFMLSLSASSSKVAAWNSSEFSQHCSTKHPFYIMAAAFSPDQNTVYVATTGSRLFGSSGFPLTGLCDAVAAFPGKRDPGLSHEWINYTGCDSLFSVAADASAVYVGGHERWANNPRGCNQAGQGAVPAPGMGAFTPGASGGTLMKNSSGTAGLYSRSRGLGADDMLITSAGLWIANDNLDNLSTCGGVSGLAGICFLPYPS
jgi:hypothetical protein